MNPDSTKKTDRGLKSTFVVVSEIAKLIAENTNGRALLVGGCVRDKLLNRGLIKDYDMEVFGVEPSTLKSLIEKHYEVNLVGDSFGVLKIKHYNIDIAIPRKERKIGDGHKAFETYSDPNMTLEEAASRRDFTINAIYFDPLDYSFKDPFGGIKDLKEKRLHIVSERFKEDPLRVLRGMQFIARFGLTPTGETISMCRSMTMEGLSRERIYDEFRKLFILGKNIGDGLAFLTATNWDSFFPGMKSAFITLLIGTNNHKAKKEDVAEGIRLILQEMRKRQPKAKIILHAIFPCNEKPDDPIRVKNDETNELIKKFADGENIIWFDIRKELMNEDGTISKEMFPDFLHPSPKGYRVWAEALKPYLEKYCKE